MKKYLFFLFTVGAIVSCTQDESHGQSLTDSLLIQVANSPQYYQYELALNGIKPFIVAEFRDINMDSLQQKAVKYGLQMDEDCYVNDPTYLTDREERYLHLSCQVDRRITALDEAFPALRKLPKEKFKEVRELFLSDHPAFDVETNLIIDDLKKN